MTTDPALDPGWRPAWRVAVRIATLRPPPTSILTMMRASVVFLSVAAGGAAFLVLVFGGGSGSPRLDDLGAQLLLFASVGAAAVVIAVRGRDLPDTRSAGHFALWAFRTTLQQVMAGAAIAPAGFLLTWLAGDPVWVVYGSGVAMLMMAVVAPTERRLRAWQEVVESEVDVVAALLLPYR